jgi:hypothetical protein
VLREWKWCLYSLGALFLLAGLVEVLAISWEIGLAAIVAGLTAVTILFVAARSAFSETKDPEIHGSLPTWEYLFETIVAGVAATGAIFFARAHPLFGLSEPVTFAWVWLGLAGLFMIVLATNTLEISLGILVLFSGVNMVVFATSLSESPLGVFFLELAPIGLALLLGLLTVRLSRLGHSLKLSVLKEKAPFMISSTTPVRIKVRRRRPLGGRPQDRPDAV